jgi:carboxylesterase type B
MAIDRAQKLAIKVSCANEAINIYNNPDDVVDCFRKLDGNFLAKTVDEMIDGFHPPFGVTVGNEFLPMNPYEAFKGEEFGDQKDVLIGSTRDEGSFFLHWTFPKIFAAKNPKKVSATQVIPLVTEAFKFLPSPGPKLVSHFFMNDLNTTDYAVVRQRFYDTIGDFVIVCPSVFFGELMSDRNSSVYHYQFTHRPSRSPWGKWMGVVHFDEVQFVFGVPFRKPLEYTHEEKEFSGRLMDTWVEFARNGRPLAQLGKEWPEYFLDERKFMELNPRSNEIGVGPHENNCNLWRFMFESAAPQQ